MSRETVVGGVAAIAVGVTAGLLWPGSESDTPADASRQERTELREQRAGAVQGNESSSAPPRRRMLMKSASLVRDPEAPGYDASRLIETGEMTVREVYEQEPRDPTFAGPRETYLSSAVIDALEATGISDLAQDVDVDCRSASCSIDVATTREHAESVYHELQVYPWGDHVQPDHHRDPDNPDEWNVTMAVAYGTDHRDETAFRAWFERVRTGKGLPLPDSEE